MQATPYKSPVETGYSSSRLQGDEWMMKKEFLRPDEAAALLSVSRWTIYRWIKEGKIEATKVGRGTLRIFTRSIDRLIQDKKI